MARRAWIWGWIGLLLVWSGASATARAAAPILGVAICEEAPYQFINERGEADGLLVELFEQLAECSGYGAEYRRYPSLRECVEALERREVDLILGMPYANSHMLAETAELYASTLVIAGTSAYLNRDQADDGHYLAGYNYQTTENVIIYSLGADRYIVTDRAMPLVQLLAEGAIDVAILDQAVLDYAMDGAFPELDVAVINNYLDTVKYTIACAQENSALLRTLNTAILELRISGDYNEPVSRWIKKDPGTNWLAILKWVSGGAAVLLALLAARLIVNFRVRRLLKREVLEKTQALLETNARLQDRVGQLQFEGRLRGKLIENAKSGMVMVDRERNIQLMNQSAERMSGFSRAEGKPVGTLPCFREVLSSVPDDIFAPGFSLDNRLVPVLSQDGHQEYFRLNIHQIVDSGQVSGALITLENVTLEQRMARAGHEKEKSHALNRMIAGIAHEIKNPLMSIRTYAGLIGKKMADEEFLASFAEFVPQEADRINNLIESLISYARPARGFKLRIDLCGLVRECTYLSGVAKRKTPIAVLIRAEGGAMIYANPDQMKQVVINMMINGIESMEAKMERAGPADAGFCLEVAVDAADGWVTLTIGDNGMGMSETALRRCVDPFYTTKERGTGLGLALSDQFIRENDGRMEIESREGEFTRFVIRFPAASKNQSAEVREGNEA